MGGARKNMRGNEQMIQLSTLPATGGGVLSLANARSLEISWRQKKEQKPPTLLIPTESV